MTTNRNQIAALNDALRRAGPLSPQGEWVMTEGIAGCDYRFIMAATAAVMSFDSFTAENDPQGEHDFGAIELRGERLFWKIDYYDLSLKFGSPNPADPAVTRRVLTIMLASEY